VKVEFVQEVMNRLVVLAFQLLIGLVI